MAHFFIDRPVFAIVLSLFISLCGGLALSVLPIAQYPQITLPTINVSTAYVGANAEVVQESVAQVIEDKVNGVEGMLYMDSQSNGSGLYSLNVTFGLERNADMAAVLTQNRAATANPSLPGEVTQAGVTIRKQTPDVLMYYALYSPKGSFDQLFLKNYGSIYITDVLKRIPGVGNVNEYGADFGMRIWLDPTQMAKHAVTAQDVSQALREQNTQVPAGTFGQYPAPSTQSSQYPALVQGRLVKPDEFCQVVLKSNGKGGFVRLGDVARCELSAKDFLYFGSFKGNPAAIYAINLTPDANALDVAEQIRAELARVEADFPPDLALDIVTDNTIFVTESMREVLKTFVEAMLLVLVVVTLFLQSWRATLIPMLAVPVSLIGTMAIFVALGFSINTLTLFALVLAIGIVVDDAIVVVEAVEHHMAHKGLNARDATIRAMGEVSGPVIATALVLCAVFVPVALLGGISGVMFRQFGLTVAVAVLLSALVALTLTPALCALLLRHKNPDKQGLIQRFFAGFNRLFDALVPRYGRGVMVFIRRGSLALLLLIALVAATAGLFKQVPSTFVPDEDQGYFLAAVSLPEGATLARTQEAMRRVEALALQIPGVDKTIGVSGVNLLVGAPQSNAGLLVVRLKDWSARTSPETSLRSIIGSFYAQAQGITEAQVLPFNPPAIPGLSATGGFSMMIQDKSGKGARALEEVANNFIAKAQTQPEIGSIFSKLQTNTPAIRIQVDREKAKKLGVPLSEVFSTLQAMLGGLQVNDFSRFGRTYKVTLQADSAFRDNTEALGLLFVRSNSGEMVPLSTLVSTEKTGTPFVLKRFNGYTAAEIGGKPAAGYSSGETLAALAAVAAETLPEGYGYEWAGLSRQEQESAGQTAPILVLALVVVFLFLAALYESWAVPFAVLLSLPLGLFGAMFTLWVTGAPGSVYTQIGLVLVLGLAAKNAILIVEFAKMKYEQGQPLQEAALEAALLRLRPILMTSFAFILGVVPLVLASGAGAAARVTLGLTVFGGMLAATLLAIFMVPLLYCLVQGLAERLGTSGAKQGDKPATPESSPIV
uniref:efflux RND transporter permease subunit n=1 Tax=Cellvibrio fontiphilus TaxID=1815559 RepID=UPI002B4BE06D|nr:multidrug efflux RND transporter permease subunit [Cellvibrio fontiphilus]